MEAGAVLQVCHAAGVACACVKIVSDDAGERGRYDYASRGDDLGRRFEACARALIL